MKRIIFAALIGVLVTVPFEDASAGAYENGVVADEKKDYRKAIEWYEIAAQKGDPLAQFKLGHWLGFAQAFGEMPFSKYLPRDDVRGAKLLMLSANQGFADAQSILALLYQNGIGVGKDYVQAYKWYGLAALRFISEKKVNFAANQRERIAALLTQQQVAEAQRLMNEWEQKSAK